MANKKRVSIHVPGLKKLTRRESRKILNEIDKELPEIARAVERCEKLAELSRYRELEMLKERAEDTD